MKSIPNTIRLPLVTALLAAAAGLVVPSAARAQEISQTAKAGPYSITLKVLPPEAFAGPKAPMAWDGGAKAIEPNSAAMPNHHLVAFITENGKPVEKATVSIRYHRVADKSGMWTALPVARMHVAGQSAATTHFGNNVKLPAGDYEVRVKVNRAAPANFKFALTDK